MTDSQEPSILLAHCGWVRALARELVADRDAADDIAQSSLLSALRRPGSIRDLRAWLGTIVRNEARMWKRHEAQRASVEHRGARAEELPPTDELVERADSERRMVEHVLALDDPYRRTLLLRHFEGLSPRAIARREGVPLATVTSRITRAHDRLRERIEKRHGSWVALVAPLAGPPQSLWWWGGSAMSMKALVSGMAALLLVLGSFSWMRWSKSRGEEHAPALPSTAAAVAPASEGTVRSTAPDTELAASRESVAVESPPRAVASNPVVETPAPTAPRSGARVAGRVLDPDGHPVADAKVGTGPAILFSAAAFGQPVPETFHVTSSDEAGRFAFGDCAPGELTLTAISDDHAPSQPLALTIEAGLDRDGVDLTLRRGGALKLLVLRPDGVEAAHREVALALEDEHLIRMVVTGDDGRADVKGLVPGRWLLSTMPGEAEMALLNDSDTSILHRMTLLARKSAEVQAGATLEVVLGGARAAMIHVTGRVSQDDHGCHALLNWFAEGGRDLEALSATQAGEDGRYTLELEHPGRYHVCVSETGGRIPARVERVIDVPREGNLTVDFALPKSALRGHVLDGDGNPVRGMAVVLTCERGATFRSEISPGYDVTGTDAEGAFAFTGLDPGTWAVAAFDRSAKSDAFGAVRSGGIKITDRASEVEVVLHVEKGARLSGTTVDESGHPIAGAALFVFAADGSALNPLSMTTSDSTGHFTTPGLAPRDHILLAVAGSIVSDPLVVSPKAESPRLVLRRGAELSVPRPSASELTGALPLVRIARGPIISGLRCPTSMRTSYSGGFDAAAWRFGPLPAGPIEVRIAPLEGAAHVRQITVVPGQDATVALDG